MSERVPRLLPSVASTALLVAAALAPAGCNPGAEEAGRLRQACEGGGDGEEGDGGGTGEEEVRVEVRAGGP